MVPGSLKGMPAAPASTIDAEEAALTTSLQLRHALVNHAELPISAAAFSISRQQLLVADTRDLRLYSGSRQIDRRQLPQTSHGSPVMAIHHNAKGDFYILVYASAEARICTPALEVYDEATLPTKQSAVLSSCWLEGRQEMVTSGSDGSIRYFSTVKTAMNTSNGRKLLSKLVPRMTIKSDLKWIKVRDASVPSRQTPFPLLSHVPLSTLTFTHFAFLKRRSI